MVRPSFNRICRSWVDDICSTILLPFGLVNAPYDGETATSGGERLEFRFLQVTTPLLCEGRVGVCILPEPRVAEVGRSTSAVSRHLAGWYAGLRYLHFAEPDARR